ncbi:MAG: hypothetical protein JNM28_09860 [Armatimonadetes bacterium]|nr:hypothetical protein [Armatimonadota bacterium]MBS1710633.1 hypothetical protein [Armatimonadota bacterium]MBX3108304.1 hypothetical protein [Fimbriimonadaceae bacterium]
MKKGWILFLAGAIVAGCAGGIGDQASTTGGVTTGTTTGTTTGSTTGGPVRSVPQVNMPSDQADVRVAYLSGQGRRVPGSLYCQASQIRLRLGSTDIIPTEFSGSTDGVNLQLDGYTTNKFGFAQSLNGSSGKDYQVLSMNITKMLEEQPDGTLNLLFNGSFGIPDVPVNVPVRPGRQTTVQVYLNNAALGFDNLFLSPTFDQAQFDLENGLTGSNRIDGFLSDMVSFDISNVASRPNMSSGGTADKFMLTGDSMGIGRQSGFDGSFDLFSPNFVESGVLTNPVILPDGTAPGTYNVLEPNPAVIPPAIVRIVALQGTWRNVTDVVNNLGDSGILIFPTTRAGQPDMAVAYVRSGGVITGLWFGDATITSSGGSVNLWPVDQAGIDAGSRTGGFTGTFSNLTKVGSKVIDGDFSLTGAPAALPATGTFAVYAL